MENIGIPIGLIWSMIGFLAIYIFASERTNIHKKFEKVDDKFKEVDVAISNNSKQLSREELKNLEEFMRKETQLILTSQEFRSNMKTMVAEALVHYNRNDILAQSAIYDRLDKAVEILERLEKNEKIR